MLKIDETLASGYFSSMLAPRDTYCAILAREYESRRIRNPSYSMRAFAKVIGLAPTRFSDLMLKKQGLSSEAARKIAIALGFTASETDYFCTLVEAEHARSRLGKQTAKERLKDLSDISENVLQQEVFHLVSDWYHFAIVELSQAQDFTADPEEIASRLGISASQAQSALARLRKLGVMKESFGKLAPSDSFIRTTTEIPSSAIKNYHEQILDKATQALNLPVQDRDFSAVNVLIDESQMDEAKAAIKQFRRDLLKKLERKNNRNRLFNLSIQFFPLDRRPS